MTRFPQDCTIGTYSTVPAGRSGHTASSPAAPSPPKLEIPAKQGIRSPHSEIPTSPIVHLREIRSLVPTNILESPDNSGYLKIDSAQHRQMCASAPIQRTSVQTYNSTPRLLWHSHPRMGVDGQHAHKNKKPETQTSVTSNSRGAPTILSSPYGG
jgi:hypothetical protein